jgi:hypothetical protein
MKKFIAVLSGLLLLPSLALSQTQHVFDLRFGEWDEKGHLTYQNFIYALNAGPWMAEIFHIRLPQAGDYSETAIGIGYHAMTLGDVIIYGIGHYSKASDDNYFQPGLFAIDGTGKWSGSIWGVYYIPLSHAGISQILIDPVEYQVNIWKSLSVGVSAYLWFPELGESEIKAGPKLAVVDHYGSSELRIARSNVAGWQLQLRRQIVF